jgi:hypothetical protein
LLIVSFAEVGMRCPSCQTENVASATTCIECGNALPRRSRPRRATVDELDNPFSGPFKPVNLPALRAYWVALWSMIPGLGLLLGPLALLLGLRARRSCLSDPEFTARGPLLASLVLGSAVSVTNWVGVTLMVLGLRNAGYW